MLGSLYLCSLAINLNFYIHCKVCDGKYDGDICPQPKGVEHFADFAPKTDLAMVRNEGGKPFIIKALFAMTG